MKDKKSYIIRAPDQVDVGSFLAKEIAKSIAKRENVNRILFQKARRPSFTSFKHLIISNIINKQ